MQTTNGGTGVLLVGACSTWVMSQWDLRALSSEVTPILSLRAINSSALLFPVPSPLVIINGPSNCNLQTDAEAVAAERRPKLDRSVRVENR